MRRFARQQHSGYLARFFLLGAAAVVVSVLMVQAMWQRAAGHASTLLKVGGVAAAPVTCSGDASSGTPRNASQHRRAVVDQLYGINGAAGLWQGVDWLEALDDEGLAPLTKAVQRWIHARQHPDPSTCARRRFMVAGAGLIHSGLGSLIHIMGIHLSNALVTDHILVWANSTGSGFADAGCRPHQNLACILAPTTGCPGDTQLNVTRLDYTAGRTSAKRTLPSWKDDVVPPYWVERIKAHYPDVQLSKAGIQHWWRAQSTAYLFRFSQRASEAVARLRLDAAGHHYSVPGANGARRELPLPYPLPGNTISVHVRHGDKHKEMALHPLHDYVAAAEHFINTNPLLARTKRAFVSSEDPDVVTEAHNLTHVLTGEASPDGDWAVITSDINRINGSPFEQLERFGAQNTTYMWLLQLAMALECDMWVGTRGSNWNRLIDELRCVWVDKCAGVYMEVGAPNDWNYDRDYWRRRRLR